jgi:hypothetical protein
VLALDPQSTSRNLYKMENRNLNIHFFIRKEHLLSSCSYNNHINKYFWEEFVLLTPFFIQIMTNYQHYHILCVLTHNFTIINGVCVCVRACVQVWIFRCGCPMAIMLWRSCMRSGYDNSFLLMIISYNNYLETDFLRFQRSRRVSKICGLLFCF